MFGLSDWVILAVLIVGWWWGFTAGKGYPKRDKRLQTGAPWEAFVLSLMYNIVDPMTASEIQKAASRAKQMKLGDHTDPTLEIINHVLDHLLEADYVTAKDGGYSITTSGATIVAISYGAPR